MTIATIRTGLSSLSDPTLLVDRALIDGEWCASQDAAKLPVTDPATGVTLGSVPACGAEDTERAIAAADTAFASWRKVPAEVRCAILEDWHRLILTNRDDLARIMTAEQGKPLAEAAGEIAYAASFVKWFAAEGRRIGGHEIPAPTADRRILARKEPVGVCALITPWNFPAAMITRKAAPALAAGCTVVIKPSELTPLTALALAALAMQAGLPAGVLNVVTGRPEAIGATLTSSSTVRMLSFTGSTRVGSLLMRQCADTVKKLGMELGGNAPFIVFDDADLDLAIEGTIASKFRNSGQTCVCANRIFVQSGIHDAYVAELSKRVEAMKVGRGDQADVTMGPLINTAARDKVAGHVADALANGATLAAQGHAPEEYTAPVVLTGMDTTMRIASEETFGPVAAIFRFEDEGEVVALANATPYGLAAYFYTNDLHRAWRVGEALEFGMVGLNTGSLALEMAPFGGIKQSGLGREGGAEGMEEFLETKAFHWAGLKGFT